MIVTAKFPDKLRFLFKPARYKVARGGRGSAKSWSFARALLLTGVENRLRILCAREIQDSIRQSVHKLLKDQIELLNLDSHYRVLETEIRGRNGTEFAFTGLSTLTVDTIKSFEGYDRCWVEEGQTISERSWQILIPTIRKEDSEIWISYNPHLETDETHQRFTINPPPDCINVEMNWRDNPFFNDVLDKERRHCQTYDPDNYDNIWEGKCLPAVQGAIYFKEVRKMEEDGRICNVPYDPLLKVHVVVDLGWEDSTAIGMVQKGVADVRIIDYIESSHKTLIHYSDGDPDDPDFVPLKARGYRWGKVWLPHDGFSRDVKTGLSSADILGQLGWNVADKETIKSSAMGVEEGIKAVRMMFPKIYADKTKCARLIECWKRYRRRINKQTDTPTGPLHDEWSHGGDMTRYIAVNLKNMHNEAGGIYKPPRRVRARKA